ncbi:Succinate dehydrogenase iron-sulfur protein [Methylophaga frappieri]|uniref:Fumarate reductase iron-sulfur subunit n=1 Tax=Methylophaga frappieri (strain ATCC BAA-2434 / DSM 25690 / JAM7) TaxID=754477 RepID=I1YET5_METFJ|nr:succinate dehydrogenase/fumarate reductase iron-sulfur subunit [Methylophaga frappieri]AFJ01428.1 Succinate dehydrogenase iron-sulfur protein [Methylophaga frappieri]
MKFILHIWRQSRPAESGNFRRYELEVSAESSFLEMLDALNEQLIQAGEEPVAFDHDCREGICGSCSLVINGEPHGRHRATTSCQQYMRDYQDQKELWIEPWRAAAFPVIQDLITDRSALDRLIQAGGYIPVRTGAAPEANTIPVAKKVADKAFDAATCIGCGACVAVCPNASATLFVAAKVSHLSSLPQGKLDAERPAKMLAQMQAEGFGSCSNYRECERSCPKQISTENIVTLNRALYRN